MEEILKIKVQLDDIFEVEGKNGSARMIAFSGEAFGKIYAGRHRLYREAVLSFYRK